MSTAAAHLWLIGMMGSGKSTVAAALAEATDQPFVDTDVLVAARTGMSIPALWERHGEPGFRRVETEVVAEVAGRRRGAVVATGGGVVLDDDNVAVMRRRGLLVWLTAPPEALAARIGTDHERPLVGDPGTDDVAGWLRSLLDERASRYEAAADEVLDTGTTTVGEVVARLEALWRRTGTAWPST